MDIRDALRDPHGVLDSWDRNAVDPCSWAMVSCSEDQVVSLYVLLCLLNSLLKTVIFFEFLQRMFFIISNPVFLAHRN